MINKDKFLAKPWIYIASPYTMGDTAINVRTQLTYFDKLLSMGVVPIAPLYSHFQHMFKPRPYIEWIELDIQMIQRCDACIRIAAEYRTDELNYHQWDSAGADNEVLEFKKLGKPVFYSLDEVAGWILEVKQAISCVT